MGDVRERKFWKNYIGYQKICNRNLLIYSIDNIIFETKKKDERFNIKEYI